MDKSRLRHCCYRICSILGVLLLICVQAASAAPEQISGNSSDAPEVTSWETVVKMPGGSLITLLRTSDGGYVYLGNTELYTDDQGELARDVVAGEVTKGGEVLWQTTLGDTSVRGRSLIRSADGGYLVLGYNESYGKYRTDLATGSKTWVVKLSPGGEVQWRKDAIGGTDYGMGIEIIPAADGGYVFVGQSLDEGDYANYLADPAQQKEMWEGLLSLEAPDELLAEVAMSSYLDIWIVKLDPTGEVEWQKTYGGTDSEQAAAIISDGGDGYVVVGDTRSTDGEVSGNNGSRDLWVLKLDSAGNLEWQKAIGGSSLEMGTDIVRAPDGGYIVLGNALLQKENLAVFKLLPSGEVGWEQTSVANCSERLDAITYTRDGGCIVAGGSLTSDYEWLVTLDSAGQIRWRKTLENVSRIVDLRPVVGGIAVTGLDKHSNVCFFTLGDEEAGLLPGEADASAPSSPLSFWLLPAALGISAIVFWRRRSGK
jgi:hypothetical protein